MLYTGCTCGLENKDKMDPKIVGGSDVGENQYPWFAQIMVYAEIQGREELVLGCGGSLITERVVATAAHCLKPNFPLSWGVEKIIFRVALGVHNITWHDPDFDRQNLVDIKELIAHEDWNEDWSKTKPPAIFDFALIILKNPVKFSKTISILCLPMKGELARIEREENIMVGSGGSQIW